MTSNTIERQVDDVVRALAVSDAEVYNWQLAHEALVQLAASRARLDFEEGQRLRAALRAGVHARLGYGSFVEYIERIFGYSVRLTYEKLRVADALEQLPELATALRDARLSWSVVRELTRVATRETEHDWLACVAGLTARQVQQRVSGHCPGSRPSDAPNDSALRHVLRFEVSAEVFAAFREATAAIRRDAGANLDDDGTLLLLARKALGGPVDAGRSSYQLAVTMCEKCQSMSHDARGDVVRLDSGMRGMIECDAEQIGRLHGDSSNACPHADGPNVRAHVGKRRPARQSVPPSVRRLVLRRDRHRCVFPGCRHSVFVDVHHIQSRADGGEHVAENLITVCGAHHRALHRGYVTVLGTAPSALHFTHSDGTAYGGSVSPLAADARATAFRALRRLGFGETEARSAIFEASAGHDAALPVEALLRTALQELTKRRVTKAA